METENGGTAAAAGLQQYDVVVAINDHKVANVGALKTQLYKAKVGDTVKISYYRDGQLRTTTAKLTN